jgi:hypothetical protein
VSEIIEDGVTGYIVESVVEAVRAVANVAALSRSACRKSFEKRFDAVRMAQDYVRVYTGLLYGESVSARAGSCVWRLNVPGSRTPSGITSPPDRV